MLGGLSFDAPRVKQAVMSSISTAVVKRRAVLRILGGSRWHFFTSADSSASPSLQWLLGEIHISGVGPPPPASVSRPPCRPRLPAPSEGLPSEPPPLSPLMEYQLYKTVIVRFASMAWFLPVATEAAERRRQSSDAQEMVMQHRGALTLRYSVLRSPGQTLNVGKAGIMHATPNKKIRWHFERLSLRMYPSQLRALFHLYNQMGIRLMKLKPGYNWNTPERSLGVGKLEAPWKPWAEPNPRGVAEQPGAWRWQLGMYLHMCIDDFSFTLRGYPEPAARQQHVSSASSSPSHRPAPLSLLHLTLRHLSIQRLTNAIDESRVQLLSEQIHMFLNDELGDPDCQVGTTRTHVQPYRTARTDRPVSR